MSAPPKATGPCTPIRVCLQTHVKPLLRWTCMCSFYRPTLCVLRAVFAIAELSVCLSVTLVHPTHRFEFHGSFFPSYYRVRIWTPSCEKPVQSSKGNTPAGALNKVGYENFAIFDRYLAISRKRDKIDSLLLWNINRKSYVLYRTTSFPVTLSDP